MEKISGVLCLTEGFPIDFGHVLGFHNRNELLNYFDLITFTAFKFFKTHLLQLIEVEMYFCHGIVLCYILQ